MARAEGAIQVEIAYSPQPGAVERVALTLPGGSTLTQAVVASGLAARYPEIAGATAGVWGRVQPGDTPLRDRDRVEIYRPLVVDPKEARRQRYKKQGPAQRKRAPG